MKRPTSNILLLLAATFVAAVTVPANAAGPVVAGKVISHESSSLYNSGESEYLHGDILKEFGPKAKNIKYDKRMIQAMQIAADRAHKHSTSRCWAYVKNALVAANLVSSRPTTEYAKQAGDELQRKYGFAKLSIKDPYAAPLGSVLVYGGKGAGHVEFRTKLGFVSDFTSEHPSKRPLIGIYVKPS